MSPFQISAIKVLLTVYIHGLSCNELYDMKLIKDIQNHFQANWIILQTCNKTDYPMIKLVIDIRKSMSLYTNIFEWEDFSRVADFGLGGTFKPLVLLSCWSCHMNCLTPINEMHHLFTRFTWLLWIRENTEFDLTNINIPLNGIFIIVERSTPHLFSIKEVYRLSVDTDLIYVESGTWSLEQGLNYTLTSWMERRSNFLGQNITTLVEKENTENPLKGIFNHFNPSYFDLAKRLNFTVVKKIDPKKYHEVSLIMDWADAPSEKAPFLPLYGSRQSIFFKDIGFGIQLDGYITPFQTAVWQTAIFIVILAGVLSYIAAKIYNRMTRNTKLPRRIDFYIYKSFYILCQRSEMNETYTAHRIITISQWIISIFLFSCYSAIFISFISVEIPKPPFTTIDELLEKKGYNIVTSKHISSNTLRFLENSGDPKLRHLYRTHFDPKENAVDNVLPAFCENKYYVFITSEVHITIMRRSPEYLYCGISKHQIPLTSRYLTWFIEKNSPYKSILQVFITKINAAGIMQSCFVKRMTFRRLQKSPDFRGITIKDTTMLFIIIVIGFILSVVILILEIAYKKLMS